MGAHLYGLGGKGLTKQLWIQLKLHQFVSGVVYSQETKFEFFFPSLYNFCSSLFLSWVTLHLLFDNTIILKNNTHSSHVYFFFFFT